MNRSTCWITLTFATTFTLVACGEDLVLDEPQSRVDLRLATGQADINPVAVTVTPDGNERFVFADDQGLYDIHEDGTATRVMDMAAMPNPGVEIRLPFTDLVALGDDKFAITAIGDGFLLDTQAQTMALHFCYEPGFMPDDFTQRTDAVTYDAGKNQIIAQPQTFDGNSDVIQSDIGYYDRASGVDRTWYPLDVDFAAGGMAVGKAGELFLGAGDVLYQYDFDGNRAAVIDNLRRFDIGSIDGLAFDPTSNSLLVVDGSSDELVEIGLEQLPERL